MKLFTLFALLGLSVTLPLFGSDTDDVKQVINSYVEAYNKKDAKKIANYWSEEAVFINPRTKDAIQGRQNLEKFFADRFKNLGNYNLKANIDSVEFPESNKAIVRGKATLTQGDQPPKETIFRSTFTKENGKWYLMGVSEVEWVEAPTHYSHLSDLDWLIGEWEDKSDTFDVVSSYHWDRNKNFIIHNFKVSALGKLDIEGNQIIGWDPVKQVVRSWMFDSDGGFAKGTWKKDGKKWIAQIASTLPSGAIGSQILTITPIDRNSYTLEITGREVDGEMLPNIAPVKIVRKEGA